VQVMMFYAGFMSYEASVIESRQKIQHDPFVQFVELLARINNRELIIQRCDEKDEEPEEANHN